MVPTFIGVIKVIIVVSMYKSRRMRWVGHAACMEEKNVCCVFLSKPERYHHEDQGIGGVIAL
jgi:hypothetical protein